MVNRFYYVIVIVFQYQLETVSLKVSPTIFFVVVRFIVVVFIFLMIQIATFYNVLLSFYFVESGFGFCFSYSIFIILVCHLNVFQCIANQFFVFQVIQITSRPTFYMISINRNLVVLVFLWHFQF